MKVVGMSKEDEEFDELERKARSIYPNGYPTAELIKAIKILHRSSKRLEKLTIVLIVLTMILSAITAIDVYLILTK